MPEEPKEDDVLAEPEFPRADDQTAPDGFSEPLGETQVSPPPNYFVDPETTAAEPQYTEPLEEEIPPLPEFDQRHRKAFEGLLYLGRVTRKVEWLGHSFVLRTMTIDEILRIGQLHEPYAGTVADVKAWQCLTIAAALLSVDGQPIAVPVDDAQDEVEAKFNYISNHWYPWVLDKLYEQYLILDAQVAEVIEAMGKV